LRTGTTVEGTDEMTMKTVGAGPIEVEEPEDE
jgi:hypothetical protein